MSEASDTSVWGVWGGFGAARRARRNAAGLSISSSPPAVAVAAVAARLLSLFLRNISSGDIPLILRHSVLRASPCPGESAESAAPTQLLQSRSYTHN